MGGGIGGARETMDLLLRLLQECDERINVIIVRIVSGLGVFKHIVTII
jgi:hypothetical protein